MCVKNVDVLFFLFLPLQEIETKRTTCFHLGRRHGVLGDQCNAISDQQTTNYYTSYRAITGRLFVGWCQGRSKSYKSSSLKVRYLVENRLSLRYINMNKC
jgi:hypothetical protein